MCGTCGCGTDENGPTILKPGEHTPSHHEHNHEDHHHHHDHDHHHHGPRHSHNHDHSHSHKQRVIEVEKDVLQNNDILAARNRGYFEAKNIFTLNLVSSPGSGKTSILEKTLVDLKDKIPFYVIEGDQQTLNDANRIDALNIPVVQINTGKGCHLESDMVYDAVKKLDMKNNSILMIENVGNLVCPSMFDLGENKRVVIISTTEGEDKPIKYPDMFYTADVCIINKIDLLPYVNIDVEKLKKFALQVNPNLQIFEVSATKGDGMEMWYNWLKENLV
ncbi:hydrogenase nickel incorporation protein HypB [uncultured Lutibacter sp.]|uniref:hydrogenase nickel incorporation protein HypB n=1 Tax=uncultured Lutibacter sp. TaxID=437739 RepID=UPI002611AEA1|nr:hydrogenase nickel incorporation protein HypB [uncultured Lutibacter sp.]